MKETYATHAKGIRIYPGQWRPHYPWEHIAWVSPSWPSQDYIWLDFPEAIFTDQGLLYLSHVNPSFPVVYPDLPKVDWRTESEGISFERRLPNGIVFGGSVIRKNPETVSLSLFIKNGSSEPLTKIRLQTCAYLRAIDEFNHPTMANKLVHIPGKGWVSWLEAINEKEEKGRFSLGWRSGPKVADKPKIVAVSDQGDHGVSITWFEQTGSLIGNPNHPCMHADPLFADLEPGMEGRILGEIQFIQDIQNLE